MIAYLCNHCEKPLDMAIKALEQEPCGKDINVPATDAISRQAVDILVDELARAISDERCFISRGRSTATIMQDILDLPSVTPQPKTGHWILANEQNKEDVENDNYRFICSKCQYSDIHAKGTIVPYCWNCGAKMDELQESEVEE